ncbi:hypothetical protein HBH26_19550 [Sphingomonas sp. 36D10-4-7]|uniref:Uncharacterized protein n=1 Tax=Sphingomonas corticis TaxID=2722791 RepID=A0ABX1CUX6_9SPHN|nr:hypothetical protein [Sphingomonas corticis]
MSVIPCRLPRVNHASIAVASTRFSTVSMGTATVIPDNRFFGVQTATASLAISERTGFDWMWWGSSAECPKIDFDLPANRAAFNIENLNPTTGTVTLTDMSGNPVTLTPKLFFHGDVAARDAGLVNKGTLETAVTLTKVAGTYAASDFSSNTIVIGDPTQRSVTSMTENDITWTPASALTAMQLEDGGWMVANPSGVGITASPPSRQRDRSYSANTPSNAAGTTGMQWTDGMGLNVGSQAAVDVAPSGNAPFDGSQQPFDSWATQNDSSQLPYSAALNIDPGRTGAPVTLTQGILTKQRSMDVVRWDAENTAASVSDLVVVPTLPASGTLLFRPPTALPTVDLFIPADNASLDLSAFPNLSPTGLGAPQFFQVYNKLKLLHTTWHLNRGTARNTSPRAHEENYGKEYAYWTGAAVLLMCLSSTTTAQKQALARALSRIGIQYTGMYEAGRRSTGSGLGGTSQGRKITLAVAAIVTGNARVLAASQAEGWLAEQRQITTITQANVDRATDPYPAAFLGRGEWTSSPVTEESYPRATWADQRVKYRHLWMNTMFGHYVAMKIVPALATAANWPAFLDYGKRYYDTENGSIAKTDGTGTYAAGTFPGDGSHTLNGPLAAFAKNMRTTFPSYFA